MISIHNLIIFKGKSVVFVLICNMQYQNQNFNNYNLLWFSIKLKINVL